MQNSPYKPPKHQSPAPSTGTRKIPALHYLPGILSLFIALTLLLEQLLTSATYFTSQLASSWFGFLAPLMLFLFGGHIIYHLIARRKISPVANINFLLILAAQGICALTVFIIGR